jgi:hypothetical protein
MNALRRLVTLTRLCTGHMLAPLDRRGRGMALY